MMPLLLFIVVCLLLMAGYPVAFTLAGTALIFSAIGQYTGSFDPAFMEACEELGMTMAAGLEAGIY